MRRRFGSTWFVTDSKAKFAGALCSTLAEVVTIRCLDTKVKVTTELRDLNEFTLVEDDIAAVYIVLEGSVEAKVLFSKANSQGRLHGLGYTYCRKIQRG